MNVFWNFCLIKIRSKSIEPVDKILYETNLDVGWSVQDWVCFLKVMGKSDLPIFEVGLDSRVFGSNISYDVPGVWSVKLFFNFNFCE